MTIKIFSKFPGIFLLCVALLVVGCEPDNDDFVPDGLDDPRDKLVGSWDCTESSQLYGSTAYEVKLTKFGEDSLMKIENFYQLGLNTSVVIAYDEVLQEITISNQNVASHTISGSGSRVDATSLSLNYIVNDGSGDDVATATYSKQ